MQPLAQLFHFALRLLDLGVQLAPHLSQGKRYKPVDKRAPVSSLDQEDSVVSELGWPTKCVSFLIGFVKEEGGKGRHQSKKKGLGAGFAHFTNTFKNIGVGGESR